MLRSVTPQNTLSQSPPEMCLPVESTTTGAPVGVGESRRESDTMIADYRESELLEHKEECEGDGCRKEKGGEGIEEEATHTLEVEVAQTSV